VLSQNARVEKGKVLAFPWKQGQRKQTPADEVAAAEQERENEAYYEQVLAMPALKIGRGGR
jgi:hypothetical protein